MHARKPCDHGVLRAASDFADRLKVAFGGDWKAGLNNVDPHVVEQFGNLELFLKCHGGARALLPVTQGGVENDYTVLLGLFGGGHLQIPCSMCAVSRRRWEGFLVSTTPECPGANRPVGPQGQIRSRSPPIGRVAGDTAGIVKISARNAATPTTPIVSLRIGMPDPGKSQNPR